LTKGTGNANRRSMKLVNLLIVPAMMPVSGCISIKAPEKPIEINLNVNIKQEVIVRLQKDAADLITSNPELFPK
jgi:hypothetical protein